MSTPPPAKRRRPAWLEQLILLLIRIVIFFVRFFPLSLARFLARGLGHTIYFFFGPNFLQVDYHLRLAFRNEFTQEQRNTLAHKFWLHFAQGIAEALLLYRWTPESFHQYMDETEFERLKPYIENSKPPGKGVILISGHLGSWEVSAYYISLMGLPVHLVHNPGTIAPIFEYVKKERERSGVKIHSRHEHVWAFKKLLDQGKWLCIAMDVNAGRYGEFVPFFGVQASSYTSPAALQQVTGCPIIVGTTARMPNGRHKLKIWKIIENPRGGGAPERLAVTREINLALEEAIRAYPEQWLWNYRRWRRRPPGEIMGPDGLPPLVEEQVP